MFSVQNLQINRGNATANGQGRFTTVLHTYKDLSSTVANIKAYFPPYLGQGITQEFISIGDHILILGSDTSNFCEISSLNPFTVGADLFSASSSGLSMLAPIAAVDQNGAVISVDTLALEEADAIHPGIVTTGTQTFGGVKTFSNIISPISTLFTVHAGDDGEGGTALFIGDDDENAQIFIGSLGKTTLGNFVFQNNKMVPPGSLGGLARLSSPASANAAFGGSFTVPRNAAIDCNVINNVVTIVIKGLSAQAVDSPSAIFTAGTTLPNYAWPTSQYEAIIWVIDNGTLTQGRLVMNTSSQITIYSNTTGIGGNFTGDAGFLPISISYNI